MGQNHWKFNGGVDEYVQWSPSASTTNDFWADPAARRLYRNHVIRIVNRRNRCVAPVTASSSSPERQR
jgi:hypothetical protein